MLCFMYRVRIIYCFICKLAQAGGRVCVCDWGNHRIVIVNADSGAFVRAIGSYDGGLFHGARRPGPLDHDPQAPSA